MILRGYRCHCPESHYQNAAYYVSVRDDGPGRTILALGPFREHDDALAKVSAVKRLVLERYNPQGRAHWYAFGTTAMASSYEAPGKLNAALDDATRRWQDEARAAQAPATRTRKPRTIAAYTH